MVLSLDSLPDEILHCVLCFCSPWSSASLERSASRFKRVTNEPLLWRFYCQKYFRYWDSRHNLPAKLAVPVSSTNWKELYVTRILVDRAVTQALDSILASQTGRNEKARTIVDFGFDAKDTLLRHSTSPPDIEDHLARRFAFPLGSFTRIFLT